MVVRNLLAARRFCIFGHMDIIGGFGFAGLFYFAAEYEHMTGWKWALASLALSATVKGLFPLSFIFILPAQFGLFLVLWWANVRRKAELEAERTARAAEDRSLRQERARLAPEQAVRVHAHQALALGGRRGRVARVGLGKDPLAKSQGAREALDARGRVRGRPALRVDGGLQVR